MTLTPTEQEELRIAISEEMGWDFSPDTAKDWKSRNRWIMSPKGKMCFRHNIPPYTTSIDAIQAAALERFQDEKQASEFRQEHGYVACSERPFRWTWQLTALDWCIAFARTAKIWRFKV